MQCAISPDIKRAMKCRYFTPYPFWMEDDDE